MGTRNLTMVVINNETKIAQYGQSDGYPEGQGLTVLKFLRNSNIELFKNRLNEVRFLSPDEIEAITDRQFDSTYNHLSREHGAEILQLVMQGANELRDSSGFAADSLFCEWAYVVDFDKNTLEVYTGFNKTPLAETERFYSLQKDSEEYKPVRLAQTFDLNALPTDKDFIAAFIEQEEAED